MKVLLVLALVFATSRGGEVGGPSNELLCDVCKMGVSKLDEILKDKDTMKQINNTLQNVCSEIPLVASECKEMVDKYLPLVIKIVSTMSAEDVCTDLHLCSSSIAAPHVPPLVKQLSADSGIGCEICEVVLKEVGELVKDNSTQTAITNALDDACDVLPSSISSDCKKAVEEYAPLLFSFFEDIDPTQACTYVGLCHSDLFLLKGHAFVDGGQ